MNTARQRSSSASSSSTRRKSQAAKASAVPPQTPALLPAIDDRDGWRAHWQAQGQPWRTEPEIDQNRQAELEQRRAIIPDLEKGIYPFKGVKLNRAEVEWLLATHEHGRGPVSWNDESHRIRDGLDLRGTNMGQVDLSNLPLARLRGSLTEEEWKNTTDEQESEAKVLLDGAKLDGVHLEGAQLRNAGLKEAHLDRAHLEQADLYGVCLEGASLEEASLKEANLFFANLRGAKLREAHLEGAYLSAVHLERADLRRANLQNTNFEAATLDEALLSQAHLEGADLEGVRLKKAVLAFTHLEGTYLSAAHLQDADLHGAYLDGAYLNSIQLSNDKHVSARLVDVQWGSANLAGINWSEIQLLGDEHKAQQEQYSESWRLEEYKDAARAASQLAIALQRQGLNAEAARFAYRAQILQKKILWLQMVESGIKFRQRMQALRTWLFSWFLFLIAGYGYRPGRSFLAYLFAISGFAITYYILGRTIGPTLSPLGAFVFSMTSFHGRGFFPGNNDTMPCSV